MTETKVQGLSPEGEMALMNVLSAAAEDVNEITVGLGVDETSLKGASAATLIEGYHQVHRLAALADLFKAPFRDALLAGKDLLGVMANNGAYVFKSGTAKLEARPRHKTVLNKEKATAVLKAKGVLAAATTTTVKPSDLEGLQTSLRKLQANLATDPSTSMAGEELRVLIDVHLPTITDLSEKKIEALVENKDLDAKDIKGMFDMQTAWALYDVTP